LIRFVPEDFAAGASAAGDGLADTVPTQIDDLPGWRYPWPLDVERLRALQPLMWRAPSAHNTQPWRLLPGPEAIEVGWEEPYVLGPSDPSRRDLRLSLGAFVETCLVVSAGAGVPARFAPAYDERARRVGRLVGARTVYRTPFTAADVTARRTWRGRFTREQPGEALLAGLSALARAGGARLAVLDCPAVHPLLVEASRAFIGSPEIVAELRRWLRPRPDHPDYHRDGLTATALGLRWWEALGMNWAVRQRGRRRRPGAQRGGPDAGQTRAHEGGPATRATGGLGRLALVARGQARSFDTDDGVVAVLLVPAATDPAGEVEAGRLVMRLLLLLARHGFAAHPHSQLIDCPSTETWVSVLAGGQGDRPIWIARIGRPQPRQLRRVPPSARRIGPRYDRPSAPLS